MGKIRRKGSGTSSGADPKIDASKLQGIWGPRSAAECSLGQRRLQCKFSSVVSISYYVMSLTICPRTHHRHALSLNYQRTKQRPSRLLSEFLIGFVLNQICLPMHTPTRFYYQFAPIYFLKKIERLATRMPKPSLSGAAKEDASTTMFCES